MIYSSEYKGILFIEGMPQDCTVLQEISTELFGQSQLKSLDDVKEQMIKPVIQAGGNAVVNFRYGQRTCFWKSLFAIDQISWYASGKIAIVKRK